MNELNLKINYKILKKHRKIFFKNILYKTNSLQVSYLKQKRDKPRHVPKITSLPNKLH